MSTSLPVAISVDPPPTSTTVTRLGSQKTFPCPLAGISSSSPSSLCCPLEQLLTSALACARMDMAPWKVSLASSSPDITCGGVPKISPARVSRSCALPARRHADVARIHITGSTDVPSSLSFSHSALNRRSSASTSSMEATEKLPVSATSAPRRIGSVTLRSSTGRHPRDAEASQRSNLRALVPQSTAARRRARERVATAWDLLLLLVVVVLISLIAPTAEWLTLLADAVCLGPQSDPMALAPPSMSARWRVRGSSWDLLPGTAGVVALRIALLVGFPVVEEFPVLLAVTLLTVDAAGLRAGMDVREDAVLLQLVELGINLRALMPRSTAARGRVCASCWQVLVLPVQVAQLGITLLGITVLR